MLVGDLGVGWGSGKLGKLTDPGLSHVDRMHLKGAAVGPVKIPGWIASLNRLTDVIGTPAALAGMGVDMGRVTDVIGTPAALAGMGVDMGRVTDVIGTPAALAGMGV